MPRPFVVPLQRKDAPSDAGDDYDVANIGGKGASLSSLLDAGFNVPEGFCITAHAYKTHAMRTALLEDLSASSTNDPDALSAIAQTHFVGSVMPGDIESNIKDAYTALGDDAIVAVRSSATAEDLPGASFAGQHDTILGVEGVDALILAVQACWASLWSPRAISYRNSQRFDHAQVSMCVVVQRLVRARVAGVAFTVDPVDASASAVVVSATYGLGEGVVGGQLAADTFRLARGGQHAVISQEIQNKTRMYSLRDSANDHTDADASHGLCVLVDVDQALARIPCLSSEELRLLADIALKAEEHYTSPQDIEFAFEDDRLYLLQSRPVTVVQTVDGGVGAGDDGARMDTPVRKATDVYTKCNIGEMMPGAVTPLTQSTFGVWLEHGLRELAQRGDIDFEGERPRNALEYVGCFSGHLFLNLGAMYDMSKDIFGFKKENIDTSLCGRLVEGPIAPSPGPLLSRVKNLVGYMQFATHAWERTARLSLLLDLLRARFQEESDGSAAGLFRRIDGSLHYLDEAYRCHFASSSVSGLMNVALGVATFGSRHLSQAQNAEIAGLLTNIEGIDSADVVKDTDAIVALIARLSDSSRESFAKEMTAGQALGWLRGEHVTSCPAVTSAFSRFITRHGHRCVREAEMRELPWEDDPTPLVKLLQASALAHAHVSPHEGGAERARARTAAVEGRLPTLVRPLFRRVLAWAKEGVRLRERTKSLCIRLQSVLKRHYRELGALMVREGIIPDADCVFFLTHDELRDVLYPESPCARKPAVAREQMASFAARRRREYSSNCRLQFPDFSVGRPVPVSAARTLERAGITAGTKSMQGTPVSRGKVYGNARVVTSLSDAADLQAGEILVVPYTDVGWTPYFTLAAGLATEMGSLVSHGAVVAREYGLPCVVNLPGATSFFKTGDKIVLDADNGIISLDE
eukprot:Opistho-2@73647